MFGYFAKSGSLFQSFLRHSAMGNIFKPIKSDHNRCSRHIVICPTWQIAKEDHLFDLSRVQLMTLTITSSTFLPAATLSRSRRDISSGEVSTRNSPDGMAQATAPNSTVNPWAKGDRQLSEIYRQLLLRNANAETAINLSNEIIQDIPENSTFGKWRSQIHNIVKGPDFIRWAARNHIDTSKPISIHPREKCIVGMVAGKPIHFDRADFSSLHLLMKAAEALGPSTVNIGHPHTALVREVASFYGEITPGQNEINNIKEISRTRAAELEDGTAFSNFSHSSSRSELELKHDQGALAHINDKEELVRLLRAAPKEDSLQLLNYLETTTISAYPAPGIDQDYFADNKHTVSLKQYINNNNWPLPQNTDELENLVMALTAPALKSPEHGDFGGALSWLNPLDDTKQTDRYIGVLSRVQRLGTSGLLGYLSNNRHWENHELRNPRRVIEQILQLPKAQELGGALQRDAGGVSTPTSANDYLLAAIHETFERYSQPSSRTKVSGFELAQPSHSGLSASAIVKRLSDHLAAVTGGTGLNQVNRQLAPIAAHLLLSKRAPEFLVKDIPDKVTYGSQAWLTFSTAVARIEAETPGATAMMNYAEILHRGDIIPHTSGQRQVEQDAKLNALMDWGVANCLIVHSPSDRYTKDQQTSVLAAFQKQMTEILQALKAKHAPLPMRKDVAADQLYDALGISGNQPYFNSLMSKLGIPGANTEKLRATHGEKAAFYDFISTKFITPTYANKDFPGPYSILDLHISNRLFDCPPAGIRTGASITEKNEWHSTKPNLTFGEIFNKSSGFPDVTTEYSEKIKTHIDDLKTSTKTTVKYLISRLPADDLKFVEQGEIEFYREELIYDQTPGSRSLYRRQPIDNKPLVAHCKIGEEIRFYEINPQKGDIYRRTDLEKHFLVGHSQGKIVNPGKDTDQDIDIPSYSKLPINLRHTTKVATLGASTNNSVHDAYDCSRTNSIADLVSDNIFSGVTEKLKDYSKGTTTFESEIPGYVKIREFILNLVPFRSAIVNLLKGNFAEAIGDLTLDILGVVTLGASTVGKVAKVSATGLKSLTLVKILGKAAISLLNPLDGISGLITGTGRAIGKLGSSGIKKIRKFRGAAKKYDLLAATKRFDASALGTFKFEGDVVKGPAVLTGGKWHAYDPILRQPFGSALDDFVPSMGKIESNFGDWAVGRRELTPAESAIKKNWDDTIKRHRYGPNKSEFEEGYHSIIPKSIKKFYGDMTPMELMASINKKGMTPVVAGALSRQYDSLAFKHGNKGAAKFIDNIDPEFGSVFPMPQAVYLSSTAQLSDGQCAALSRTLATAIAQGKEKTFINNMYIAAAHPTKSSSREFMQSLSKLQSQTGGATTFHAQKPVRLVTYQDMVKELSSSTVSKSIMIDSPGHAMAAGVIVNGADKKFYFYDPNFGIAHFPTANAMDDGLTKLFNDNTLSTKYRTHGTDPKKLEFKVFDHDDTWKKINSIDDVKFKKLYEAPLDQSAVSSISHEQLKRNWETLQKAPGNQGLICYEASMRVGQAEKNLSPEVFDAVIATTNRRGSTNYSQNYLDIMGIKPDSLKTTFNPADITESGLLNFRHAHEGGGFGHTVYIQKTSNNELFLFNTNSVVLDAAMIRNGNPPQISGGMTVYNLGDGKHKGLQDFLGGLDGKDGWQFAYTPASTLNANVQNLKP